MKAREIEGLIEHPVAYAHILGYDLLEPRIHNRWIRLMAYEDTDYTLQAHRDSYKTTCMIVALALRIVLFPNEPNLLVRKDEASTGEVVRAVRRILRHEVTQDLVQSLYGKPLEILKDKQDELQTNLVSDFGKKESQLLANGAQSFSITGKHFPRIFTDDIITMKDRISKPARDATDLVYQELQNIRTKQSVMFNTGTPWHRDDTFKLMPKPERWTVYDTGLLSDEQILQKKNSMTLSLFCANYELKHVSDEDSLFTNPKFDKFPDSDSVAQIDASYGGDNTTALTILSKHGEKLFVFGKVYNGHVQNHMGKIVLLLRKYRVGTLFMETNADKGYLATEFRKIWSAVRSYSEGMNKHIKIVTYLLRDWSSVYFDPDTDSDYLEQIVDYQEGKEPDDAPDSISSLLREHFYGKVKAVDTIGYRRT
jgi:hypothetical protein